MEVARWPVRLGTAIPLGIGLVAAAGWATGVPALRQVFVFGGSQVKVTTAAALVAAGLCLWVKARRARLLLGVAVLALGGVSLAGYGLAWATDGRMAGWWHGSANAGHALRMSLGTAVALTALGGSLALGGLAWGARASQLLAVAAGTTGYVACVGYLFHGGAGGGLSREIGPALPTAVAVMWAAAAGFLMQPGRGFAAVATSELWGGRLYRRLIPVFALGWPLVGALVFGMQQRGLLTPTAAAAMFTAATVISLGCSMWFAARDLNSADSDRERSESALRGMNERLESRVEERGRELELSERHFSALAEAVPAMIWVADERGDCTYVNRVYAEFIGKPVGVLIGRGWLSAVHEEDVGEIVGEMRAAAGENREFSKRVRMRRRDGEYRWVHFRAVPRSRPEETHSGFIGACVDVTEWELAQAKLHGAVRKSEEALEREKTLRRELDHRVRNNLAGLIGLVSLYQRDGRSVDRMAEEVKGKIRAMKEVHDIIVKAGGRSVTLNDLLSTLLSVMCSTEALGRVSMSGPAVIVGAQGASALAMIVQELTTNSFKHGALGGPGGEVAVRWELEKADADGRMLRLTWEETGGLIAGSTLAAPEGTPREGGVGLRLIEGFARSDLRGDCEFVRGGGRWTCVLHARLDMGGREKTEKHQWLQTAA